MWKDLVQNVPGKGKSKYRHTKEGTSLLYLGIEERTVWPEQSKHGVWYVMVRSREADRSQMTSGFHIKCNNKEDTA